MEKRVKLKTVNEMSLCLILRIGLKALNQNMNLWIILHYKPITLRVSKLFLSVLHFHSDATCRFRY